jgi:hypothetical protein
VNDKSDKNLQMGLSSDGSGATLGSQRIDFVDFPILVRAHLDQCWSTVSCEAMGARLYSNLLEKSSSHDEVWDFIVAVCTWGGRTGNRVRGLVSRGYVAERTLNRFEASALSLSRIDSSTPIHQLRAGLTKAAQAVDDISGLATSYATKMVRFLRPDVAAVLDNVISGVGGYPLDNYQYGIYSADCLAVAADLSAAGIVNPRSENSTWRVGDVDQALFARCQGWR